MAYTAPTTPTAPSRLQADAAVTAAPGATPAPPPSVEQRTREWIRQNPVAASVLALAAGSLAMQGALLLWRRPAPVQVLQVPPVPQAPRVKVRPVKEPNSPWLAALVQFATADRKRDTALARGVQDIKERSGIEHAIQEASTLWASRQRLANESRDAVADAAKAWRSSAADLADDASLRVRADAQAAAALVQHAGEQALVQLRRSATEHPLGTIAAAAGIAFALTLLSGRR